MSKEDKLSNVINILMNILVTGGAGYIGSVTAHKLINAGHTVSIIDNLSKGLKTLLHPESNFQEGDLIDAAFLSKVFKTNSFDAVFHFAAYKDAGESMTNTKKYTENITGTINLLEQIALHKIPKLIFSSSAAVYGAPQYLPIDEKHPTQPTNYYGYTKLACEELIDWYSQAHNFTYVSLRYFNVIGDGGLKYIDPRAKNILPILLNHASGKTKQVMVFGADYPTPDGTCIRDYIDINDLVEAHIKSLNLKTNEIINLGSAKGTSVFDLIKHCKRITNKTFTIEMGPRRTGDPENLVASFAKAQLKIGWHPTTELSTMIKRSWEAYTNSASTSTTIS